MSEVETIKVKVPKRLGGPGRTIHEAVQAGNYYELSRDGRDVGSYPGCTTILESLQASARHGRIATGDVITVNRHLPGSRIGATFLEYVTTVRVEICR